MEFAGVRIDVSHFKKLARKLRDQMIGLEREISNGPWTELFL